MLPLDEVSLNSRDFGVQVYAAVKRAGIRTYATTNPIAPDAHAYAPFVDIWCSQTVLSAKRKFDSKDVQVLEVANDPSTWIAETDESALIAQDPSNAEAGALHWKVSVDHQKAGDDDGNFLLGWPRIRRLFAKGEIASVR